MSVHSTNDDQPLEGKLVEGTKSMTTHRESPPTLWAPGAVEIDAEVGVYLSPTLRRDTQNPPFWHWCTKANNDAYIHSPRYPAGHGWTPTGRFGPVRCKVLLARYSCPYPREEHDPNLPPEDVDFSGRRRPRDPQAPHDHRESIAGCFRCDLRREETTDAEA